ncbi:hypothetical protein [uncultured Amnibacterium sp.]|uniref:hypothetical protein n=1 Tax=uncultured Amnibacterium sp. TaxID=1631851 RepID=UPI0035CBF610
MNALAGKLDAIATSDPPPESAEAPVGRTPSAAMPLLAFEPILKQKSVVTCPLRGRIRVPDGTTDADLLRHREARVTDVLSIRSGADAG